MYKRGEVRGAIQILRGREGGNKGILTVKLHDLALQTGHIYLKQGNIIITHTFMLHICTFNVKIIKI